MTVPLEKQMWGDEFGMCTDRFGITWMVNIAASRRAEPERQSARRGSGTSTSRATTSSQTLA